jgi:BASS family bile acid:Na+ symporter
MSSPDQLDSIRLNFSQGDLLLLNLALALIMYGVALDLRWDDFRYLAKNPKGFVLGILSQIVFLPFLTWILVQLINARRSVSGRQCFQLSY